MKNWQKIKNNPALKQKFMVREKVVDAIRSFFKEQDFHEVETPLMVKSPGTEPFLEVFQTRLVSPQIETDAFLLTSPEYAMKKLVAAGMGSIFQICKSFRNNEPLGGSHNPEFTILEWYRVNADYKDIMHDFEKMMLYILSKFGDEKSTLEYQGKSYDFSIPYPRLSVAEVFEKYVGVSVEQLLDRDKLIEVSIKLGYQADQNTTWEEAYHQLFLNMIEPELSKFNTPVIIYDYPASQAALSKKKDSDPRFAERFEVYLAGLELGNAFSELINPVEQKSRLEEELQIRKKLGKTKFDLDLDFINALESGMPATGGIAVGVDRLVMLFADVADIEETLFFPASEVFLKPV